MVERRDKPAEKPGRPRARLARMISSKRRMDGCEDGFLSRSWINSLKTKIQVSLNSLEKMMPPGASDKTYSEYPASW